MALLYGMSNASNMIACGRYKKVLLIGSDKMSSIIDYSNRATCIIFGDGAGGALFEPSDSGYGWEDEYLRSDGTGLIISRIGFLFPWVGRPSVIKKILSGLGDN